MVDVVASVFNGYVWERKEKIGFDMGRIKDFLSSDAFKCYPCYTREEFFEYLCNSGMERAEAFKINECIRKGYGVFRPERLLAYNIPKEVLEVARNYCYVVSRAYDIKIAYRYWKTELEIDK